MRFDVYDYLLDRVEVRTVAHGKHGEEVVCDCPWCGGASKLWVNKETGAWTCYKGCGGSADVARLVMRLDGKSYRQARNFVKATRGRARSLDHLRELKARRAAAADAVEVKLPTRFVPIWDGTTWRFPEYLGTRGVRRRTARDYGLGYVIDRDCEDEECKGLKRCRYAGRIILPTFVNSELRTFQGRAMGPHIGLRYMGPPKERAGALFGYDLAVMRRVIVVAEGPFDVLALYQHGHAAVAIMGKSITPAQVALLAQSGCEAVVVLLDASAQTEAREVQRAIGAVLPVAIGHLPPEKDPGDAGKEACDHAISTALRELNLC